MITTNVLAEPTVSRQPERSPQVCLPSEIWERYIEVAMRGAVPSRLEDGTWYADLPGFEGVWADGQSPKECLDTLEQVLRDWVLVKIADGDKDLPVVDDIDLAVVVA